MGVDNSANKYAYVALCPTCGGWQAVSVICPQTNKDMGRYFSQCHRWGLTIERWTVEKFRKEAVSCECIKKPKKATQKELPK